MIWIGGETKRSSTLLRFFSGFCIVGTAHVQRLRCAVARTWQALTEEIDLGKFRRLRAQRSPCDRDRLDARTHGKVSHRRGSPSKEACILMRPPLRHDNWIGIPLGTFCGESGGFHGVGTPGSLAIRRRATIILPTRSSGAYVRADFCSSCL